MSKQPSGPHVDTRSSLPVLVKAVWLVMKTRDVQNYGRIVEFLELTHEQVPALLCYMHHAKLSTGLRGKIVLHMIEDKKPLLDILTALNRYFPPVFPDDSSEAQGKAFKVQQSKIHFRKLVLRMIRDEKFRQNYVTNTLHLEYGDAYMAALEKLLWEFLCRLQTILNHRYPRVPQTPGPPAVDEEHLSSTPHHRSSGLNFSKIHGGGSTMAKKKRTNPRTHSVAADGPEENPSVTAQYEEHRNFTKNKPDYWKYEGNRQSTSQSLVQDTNRRTLDLIRSVENHADEPQRPYFEIFGLDCSQTSKVNHCENLSPPDPLQSQGHDPNLERTSDTTGHGSCTDIQVTDVAQARRQSPVSSHVSRRNHEGQGRALAQGLMTGKWQPRVHLRKLPFNIIDKNQHEENVTPQVADSELSPSETVPESGGWSWVCSDPTDNDSNDPDYFPGHSFFRPLGEQMCRIQQKRGLRFPSLP
ncbi:TERF1-interacting nuclear factor 2 isoform X1 [Bufo bufo]|uniref:TERF1-interacting nuclear factor 2 isoform X1 n=1 Tax=Bufo bufo TaxID=8384 RepID=UPI001ABED59D|nr:TERF1-interacting nuclear factor 2 isoform X1 [Bufo bufo]